MKKIIIQTSIIVVCFTSMSFRGCFSDLISNPAMIIIQKLMFGQYDYADNTVALQYTLGVGSNGTILRGTGTSNYVFQQILMNH